MNEPAIIVEGLSKKYKIGLRRQRSAGLTGALMDLARWPANRLRALSEHTTTQDEFWALRDVSFDVYPGEVVGIVGRNGAGKSTLLKVLSSITEPTAGRALLRGRVGSLLEVGTGFHRELTGRENIYLSGTLFGMKKAEIDRLFDEIVAFAGVETFIETPVKRYSSGMYVRLAFAVAAHLQPEIMFVDEVLAVGDAAFQKKCLGKMGDVARQGRTILFVSHNMAAIQSLCQRAIRLESGRIADMGTPREVIERYLGHQFDLQASHDVSSRPDRRGSGACRITDIRFTATGGATNVCLAGAPVRVEIDYAWGGRPMTSAANLGFTIWNMNRQPVAECKTAYAAEPIVLDQKAGTVMCELPELPLVPGQYLVDVCLKYRHELCDALENAMVLTVEPSAYLGGATLESSIGAVMLVKQNWSTQSTPCDARPTEAALV